MGDFLGSFWARVDVRGPRECWPWRGALEACRYGHVSLGKVNGKPVVIPAHRLSWQLAHRMPIPEGQWILHSCDNPPCVNPAHLRVGDAQANAWDKVDRGRSTRGRKIKQPPRARIFLIAVVVESPWRGDTERNRRYLKDCLLDSLKRGESPYASHGLLGDALNDNDPAQRALALKACASWRRHAEIVAVYSDLGISVGMQEGVDHAVQRGIRVEYRSLPQWQKATPSAATEAA